MTKEAQERLERIHLAIWCIADCADLMIACDGEGDGKFGTAVLLDEVLPTLIKRSSGEIMEALDGLNQAFGFERFSFRQNGEQLTYDKLLRGIGAGSPVA